MLSANWVGFFFNSSEELRRYAELVDTLHEAGFSAATVSMASPPPLTTVGGASRATSACHWRRKKPPMSFAFTLSSFGRRCAVSRLKGTPTIGRCVLQTEPGFPILIFCWRSLLR